MSMKNTPEGERLSPEGQGPLSSQEMQQLRWLLGRAAPEQLKEVKGLMGFEEEYLLTQRIVDLDINRGGSMDSLIHQAEQSAQGQHWREHRNDTNRTVIDTVLDAEAEGVRVHEGEQFVLKWTQDAERLTKPFEEFQATAETLYNMKKYKKVGKRFSKTYVSESYTSDDDGHPEYGVKYSYHLEKGKVVLDAYEQVLQKGVSTQNYRTPRVRMEFSRGQVAKIMLMWCDMGRAAGGKGWDNRDVIYNADVNRYFSFGKLLERWQPYFRDVDKGNVFGIGFIVSDIHTPQFASFIGESYENIRTNSVYKLDGKSRNFVFAGEEKLKESVYDAYWVQTCKELASRREWIDDAFRRRKDETSEINYLKKEAMEKIGQDGVWEIRRSYRHSSLPGIDESRPPKRTFTLNAQQGMQALQAITEYIQMVRIKRH